MYRLVILEKEKNIIVVKAKKSSIASLADLKKELPENLPVVLVLNGKGIINRKIADQSFSNDVQLISQILPNAKPDDFYLQKFYAAKNLFVSVIRRDTFEDIRSTFSAQGISIINATSGPFIIQVTLSFLAKNIEQVHAGAYLIKIHDQQVSDFSPQAEVEDYEVTIGEDSIPASLTMAYAVALSEFIGMEEESIIESQPLLNGKSEFKDQQLFKVIGYAALAFFVVLLSINYFFYSYYKSENGRLMAESASFQQAVEDVKVLEKKVGEKEYFMKTAGWFSLPKTSYYADDVAASIPSSIKLTALKVNPINDKVSKKLKKEVFRADTIIVSGVCDNPTVLNPWMEGLKSKSWIKSLSHLNYEYDHKSGAGNFEIEVRVADGF